MMHVAFLGRRISTLNYWLTYSHMFCVFPIFMSYTREVSNEWTGVKGSLPKHCDNLWTDQGQWSWEIKKNERKVRLILQCTELWAYTGYRAGPSRTLQKRWSECPGQRHPDQCGQYSLTRHNHFTLSLLFSLNGLQDYRWGRQASGAGWWPAL